MAGVQGYFYEDGSTEGPSEVQTFMIAGEAIKIGILKTLQ